MDEKKKQPSSFLITCIVLTTVWFLFTVSVIFIYIYNDFLNRNSLLEIILEIGIPTIVFTIILINIYKYHDKKEEERRKEKKARKIIDEKEKRTSDFKENVYNLLEKINIMISDNDSNIKIIKRIKEIIEEEYKDFEERKKKKTQNGQEQKAKIEEITKAQNGQEQKTEIEEITKAQDGQEQKAEIGEKIKIVP